MCLQHDQAFVFTCSGVPVGEPAHCLHDLIKSSEDMDKDVITSHLRRHDFSRWIENVGKDNELAMSVQKLENRYNANGSASEFTAELTEIIKQKYNKNFSDPPLK
jgi:hypothetical protein